MLVALDHHIRDHRCRKDLSILLVGLGCASKGGKSSSGAESVAHAVRLGLPFASLFLSDDSCSDTEGTRLASALKAEWQSESEGFSAGKPVFDVVAVRGGNSDASTMLDSFSRGYNSLKAGGSILLGGMESSYSADGDGLTPGTVAGLLQAIMDANHLRPENLNSPVASQIHKFPSHGHMLGRFKSVECTPGVCAAVLWGGGEVERFSDGGAYAGSLKSKLPSFMESLKASQGKGGGACKPLPPDDETVWMLGLGVGTDKVSDSSLHTVTHWYQEPYARHFGRRRCSVKNVLEIGLGCDMHYPPGAAFSMWLDFFTLAKVSYMEFVAGCVEKFNAEDPKGLTALFGKDRWTLHQGDQTKVDDLLRVHKAHGDFDLVIDDGGHTMLMQILTLKTLLPFVLPGGIYVLEDFHTSYIDWVAKDGPGGILVRDYFVWLFRELHLPGTVDSQPGDGAKIMFGGIADMARTIKAIDCTPQCCTITKLTSEEAEFLDSSLP